MTFPPLPRRPRGGFRCVLADPPWSFRDKGSRAAPDQRRKRWGRKGYRTLSYPDVAGLGRELERLLADDAFLFLWTTSAHLIDGSSPGVARSWGFEPKTTLAWVKTRPGAERQLVVRATWTGVVVAPPLAFGMGHYVRGAHELLLVCRRGRAQVLRRDVSSVLFAPRREHSRKPTMAVRSLLDTLCRGPHLELFARDGATKGWTVWGDQVP